MADRPFPTPERLRQLLDYDRETGLFTWRERTPDMFNCPSRDPEWECKRWNSRFSGRPALNVNLGRGYLCGRFEGPYIAAHRAAYTYVTGRVPNIIDHINGVRDDNRFCNLRDATHTDNARNAKKRRDNKSGVTGVSFHVQRQKWFAFIGQDGKMVSLGVYAKKDDAISARKAAEDRLGYHDNHGRQDAKSYD